MATLLDTGLDRDTLALCISLCERGVNPEALAVSVNNTTETKGRNLNHTTIECYQGVAQRAKK